MGGWFQYENSTYKNYYYMYSFKPSVEYDFFPYSESTRKRLTFNYSLGFEIVKYYEETIYGKLNDTLLKHQLYVTLDVKEIWGTSSLSLFAKQYLYDFSKYQLGISTGTSLNLIKGVSVNISGEYAMLRDQINLAKGNASMEEVLLMLREIESNYSFGFSIGISYTFGSIYSNIVNPRFELY